MTIYNNSNTFIHQQQPLPSSTATATTSTRQQRQRRFTPWTTLVFTLALAAVAVCASTTATPIATVEVSVAAKSYRDSPATIDSSSSSTGLIGCVPDDDKGPSFSTSSSFESSDSLPSSSSPLPTSFSHSLTAHKDTFLCPSCTDNPPASLPSTGRPNPQGPLSFVPSRFSTNRPHPLEHTRTCASCRAQLALQLPLQSTSDNTNDDFVTPPSPTMFPVSSSFSSPPLSPSPQQTQPPASSSHQHHHHTLQQHQQQQPSFPEPIVFQYVLYYPGNLPLVITAGHGGSAQPGEVLTRKKTHRFRRIPDLATTTDPIEILSFAEPLYPSTSQSDLTTGAAIIASLNSNEETMPWMAPRDQTKGGNFKKDLNTHSIALNLANAISCLTSGSAINSSGVNSGPGYAIIPTTDGTFIGAGPTSSRASSSSITAPVITDHGTNDIPARCEQQGPWGDDDSDYPFPTWTSLAPSPTPTRTSTPTTSSALHQQQQDSARRHFGQQGQNYPHVIVFRIPRQFVDVNRNITGGENAIAEGDPHAEAAWHEYHELIDHVQKMALQKANISVSLHREQEREHRNPRQQKQWMPPQVPAPGRGLLLDIHGHAHATNLIEIGYLLNGTILNMDDDHLNAYGARLTKESSIRSLINEVTSSSSPSTSGTADSATSPREALPFSKLIRGGKTESLGGMFQAQELNAVPSPDFQAPCQECIYFFGGYTIQRHGSRDHTISDLANNDTMDAIQLELPKILRLVEKEQSREVGMKLGRAVVEFAAKYYGLFRESPAIAAREQPDTVIMAAMAKGASSRSGASTPRRSGAAGSGRGGGRTGTGGGTNGGIAGQVAHSARLQERLARVQQHSHNRAQQHQHQHHYQPRHHPQPTAQAIMSGASTSSLSFTTTAASDSWDNQSGDSNHSGDSEIENDREKRNSVSSSSPRRPEIKRQISRL